MNKINCYNTLRSKLYILFLNSCISSRILSAISNLRFLSSLSSWRAVRGPCFTFRVHSFFDGLGSFCVDRFTTFLAPMLYVTGASTATLCPWILVIEWGDFLDTGSTCLVTFVIFHSKKGVIESSHAQLAFLPCECPPSTAHCCCHFLPQVFGHQCDLSLQQPGKPQIVLRIHEKALKFQARPMYLKCRLE